MPSRGACGILRVGGSSDVSFQQGGSGVGGPLHHLPVFGAHQANATARITAAQQLEGVEIVPASPQTPVKAAGAMRAGTNPTDQLTSRHLTTDADLRYHRLVRCPEGAVVDHHDAAAGDLSGEADRPGCSRAYRGTGTGSQVHPAVTRVPAQQRRPKSADDGGWTVYRPDAMFGWPRQC